MIFFLFSTIFWRSDTPLSSHLYSNIILSSSSTNHVSTVFCISSTSSCRRRRSNFRQMESHACVQRLAIFLTRRVTHTLLCQHVPLSGAVTGARGARVEHSGRHDGAICRRRDGRGQCVVVCIHFNRSFIVKFSACLIQCVWCALFQILIISKLGILENF